MPLRQSRRRGKNATLVSHQNAPFACLHLTRQFLCQLTSRMEKSRFRAPTARNIKARGKRVAKRSASPLDHVSNKTSSPEKGEIRRRFISALQASMCFGALTRGDVLASLRTCPWLLFFAAPLALSHRAIRL